MKRRQRHLALPKQESKIVQDCKRTVCTTVENNEDRKDHFDPQLYKRTKQ